VGGGAAAANRVGALGPAAGLSRAAMRTHTAATHPTPQGNRQVPGGARACQGSSACGSSNSQLADTASTTGRHVRPRPSGRPCCLRSGAMARRSKKLRVRTIPWLSSQNAAFL
jgi:hypothetical protein